MNSVDNAESMSICAVVVTFNRKECLARCLEALIRQDRPLNRIIVIDNASTDGTHEMLQERFLPAVGILSCIRLQNNIGGAGGFFEGMRRFLAEGWDWVWLMDDDGYPDASALSTLLAGVLSFDFLVGGPLVIDVDARDKLAFGLDQNTHSLADALAQGEIIAQRLNPFNGTLIHRRVVQKVGLVKREMFLWGDEREYLFRLLKENVPFATFTRAHFYHPTAKGRYVPVLWGRLRPVLIKPESLFHIYLRNLGYLDRHYRGTLGVLSSLVRYSLYFIMNRKCDFAGLLKFFRYYADGFFDRYRLPSLPGPRP
ncbi:MAG: glycosyltransferase [Gammaproteobacteria bacterium]|nr:MAG: glycosyltransferase [Gammaproteobacteria bacterium]